MSSIGVTLNGEPRTVPGPSTLEELLSHLDLDPRAVVVEHNRMIVRRDELAGRGVSNGDTIEIVHFVGGG